MTLRALGVVSHNKDQALARIAVTPWKDRPHLVVVGIEAFYMEYVKNKDKVAYIVLDLPGHLRSIGLEFVGATEVTHGRYTKTRLVFPSKIPEFAIDPKLLASKLTIHLVKASIRKEKDSK